MQAGLPVSIAAHVALIVWGVISLPAPSPVDATGIEMIPVDFIEIDDATQLTRGLQTAALVEEAPPPAPPVEEPPPLPRPAPPPPEPDPPPPPPPPPEPEPPPVPPPPPPEPEPPPPTPSPEAAAPPPEPSPPPPDAVPPPEPQVAKPLTDVPMPRIRPVRQPPQQAEAAPQPEPTDEFDVDRLTAMLDQPVDEPALPAPAQEPTLGSPTAPTGVAMTANELDALRARLAQCWSPPIGWIDPSEVRVVLLLALNADGSVNGEPRVMEAPQGQFARQAPESALRAVRRCAPYNLPAEKYDAWREVKVTFDPQDMGRI